LIASPSSNTKLVMAVFDAGVNVGEHIGIPLTVTESLPPTIAWAAEYTTRVDWVSIAGIFPNRKVMRPSSGNPRRYTSGLE
jgi:hypothetical protein